MGTLDYMAPEQAMDTHQADARADIYALGCTLYRLLAGDAIYQGDTMAKILIAHQMAPIPSLCKARGDVSPPLDAVFQKMVAKKPDERYQSMTEVIADLESCLGKRETTSTSVGQGATSVLSRQEHLSPPQKPSAGGAATAKKTTKARKLAEATISQPVAAGETSKQFRRDEKLQAAPRKRKTLIVAGSVKGSAGFEA
jgi:serine/threonine protein kinase